MISIRDKFQVTAFQIFYKAALIGGAFLEQAFATAIAKSSDDEVDALVKKAPNLIDIWYQKRAELKIESSTPAGLSQAVACGE